MQIERKPGEAPRRGSALSIAQELVAHVYDVPVEELRAEARLGRRTAEARQVAMYLSHVVFGLTQSEVGRGFHRDRTTARHACARIEALRDDPERDRLLAWLEALVRQAAGLKSAHEGAAP